MRRSYSLTEAAAALHCSRRTIYNRIRDGRLTTIRIQGSLRVLTDSLVQECLRRKLPPPEESRMR
jgi:excisionase family DNA binding protein